MIARHSFFFFPVGYSSDKVSYPYQGGIALFALLAHAARALSQHLLAFAGGCFLDLCEVAGAPLGVRGDLAVDPRQLGAPFPVHLDVVGVNRGDPRTPILLNPSEIGIVVVMEPFHT